MSDSAITKTFKVTKADDDQRIVWGWASVATEKGELVIDTQGDIITPHEMTKMANAFMSDVRTAKAMHTGDGIGEVLHSFPVTKDLADALGVQCDREGWIIGMQIHADKWPAMKRMLESKTFTGFSIGGRSTREEKT